MLDKKYIFCLIDFEIYDQKQNYKRASAKYLHLAASELNYQQMF